MANIQWESTVKSPMWVGSIDDLRRLLDVVEEIIEKHRRKARDEAVSEYLPDIEKLEEEIAAPVSDPLYRGYKEVSLIPLLEFKKKSAEDAKNLVDTTTAIHVHVLEYDSRSLSINGTVQEIMSQVDARTCKSLRIGAGSVYHLPLEISINLSRESGVSLQVCSSDIEIGQFAFAAVETELKKCKPSWAWIFRTPMTILLMFLICVSCLFAVGAFIGFTALRVTIGLLSAFAVSLLCEVVSASQWLAPRFVLEKNEVSGSASYRIRALVAGIAWIIPIALGFIGLE